MPEKDIRRFQQNEISNGGQPAKMSRLTVYLLSHIDFDKAAAARKSNFSYLHDHLKAGNNLKLQEDPDAVPFFYPYLPEAPIDKKKFWAENVFVPALWTDCLKRQHAGNFSFERGLR